MNIASTIARLLVGLLFAFTGVMTFVMGAPPPQPGLAGAFDHAYFASHFSLFFAAAQLIIGVLLLANRYVPIALIMLAAFLYNSFAYHITMAPGAIFAPIVVLALWTLIALRYRSGLTPLIRPS